MAKNFCPICGTALVPGLDACPNCGRRIGFLAARVIAWAVFFVLTFVLFLIMAVASPAFYY